MWGRLRAKGTRCALAAAVMLLAAPVADAAAAASVRFVHAVPGADAATLRVEVGGRAQTLSAAFGEISDAASVPAGDARLALAGGGQAVQEALRDGARYTVVAVAGEQRLRVFEAGQPRPGAATLRTIHAAPELGKVDVQLGNRVVANGLGFGVATGYRPFEPGSYDLSVSRAGGAGDSPLVSADGLTLNAGSASTAVIVGSAGEPLEIVTVTDATSMPSGAPATGLSPETPSAPPPWPLVAWGALGAGLLGLAAYGSATGRRRRGDRAA